MNVLQINVVPYGSTGRIASVLNQSVRAEGGETKFIYGRGQTESPDQVSCNTNFDVNLHAALTRLTDGAGLFSRSATRRMIKEIRLFEPDIIHLHNIHGYYLSYPLLFDFLRECGKPVVWTLHDCWSMTGHCYNFSEAGCGKWRTGCNKCPLKQEYPKSYLDFSARNWRMKKQAFTSLPALHLVTPSHWLEGIVEESYLSGYPHCTIHNGVALSDFHPVQSDFRVKNGLENKKIALSVAGAWSELKGWRYALDMAKLLPESWQVVMVGLTEKQMQALPSNILGIRRTGSVRELAEIYTAADVLFNPTLGEALSMVNLEAMACGTPVVTFDTDGAPECLDEGCGAVVPKGDIQALADAVLRAGEGVYDAKTCIDRVRSEFSEEIFTKRYLSLYRSLVFT